MNRSLHSPFPRYVVITPARNEEANIVHTIASMVAQTVRPLKWVIVNDGSTDSTGQIIDSAAETHPWITAQHRPNRGYRKQGGGVIDTFYAGYDALTENSWDFLIKFDADLSFQPDYFFRCFNKFAEEPDLGIGGGVISHLVDNQLIPESPGDPRFHVRGATKIYRRQCWKQLGGLKRAPGWDTIDELKANMLGWKTRTFLDIPLRHHRFCGAADGTWNNYVKFGLSNYITGYHPLFMLAKCARRTVARPYFVGALALLAGYLKGHIHHIPRVEDPKLIEYVRKQQVDALLGRPSLWR